MRTTISLTRASEFALLLSVTLGGCGKLKQDNPREAADARAEAKRQQHACGSAVAYDALKGVLFDEAVRQRAGDRASLDTLADYSFVRMEDPVVSGADPTLDITRCKGHLILEIPAGARQAFGGEQHLKADVAYTAQAAADGNGLVYQITGATPIVSELAAFNLNSRAYRPSPAIDERQAAPEPEHPVVVAQADVLPTRDSSPPVPAATGAPAPSRQAVVQTRPAPTRAAPEPDYPMPDASAGGSGEATVRAFYGALGTGNGDLASAQVIPESKTAGRSLPTPSRDTMAACLNRCDPRRLGRRAPGAELWQV